MLKVLCVVDKVGTALDRLAKGVAPYHTNLDYEVVDVHPKRPSQEQLERFTRAAMMADVIDYQYYRTADVLREMFPWLKDKKSILTHNNPYSITERDWNDYDLVVANNLSIFDDLKEITEAPLEYVPLTVDHTQWKFNPDYKGNRTVIMVANRIESKKGILPVAVACADIGAKMVLVGAISDADYFHGIMSTGNVDFREQITDNELLELYYDAGIHVCNSVDGFESGTLPLLEAAFCGVPILTRSVGHVPDIYDKNNMVIQHQSPEASESISRQLSEMFSDKKRLEELRSNAWNSVKGRNHERRAYSYQGLYRQVLFDTPSVSVVMPVAGSLDVARKAWDAVADQTYKNVELIVVDDSESEPASQSLEAYAKTVNFPVRYVRTSNPEGYNLAEARNRGIIEATGDFILFCDQRMVMAPNAVENFMKQARPRVWLYGNKGAKKEFVENFSFISRPDVIQMGMFNERIDAYGGMSQECRSRARKQGIETIFVESAKATPSRKSANRSRKRNEIILMKNLLWKIGLE